MEKNFVDWMDLMETAADEITHILPDMYEVDDLASDEAGIQVCIFNVSTMESSCRPVDRFRFFSRSGETKDETISRFHEELDRFIDGWRDAK